jgi:hypothetical protein
LESASGTIEDGVEIALVEELLAERNTGVVRVREKRVLDDDIRLRPFGFAQGLRSG